MIEILRKWGELFWRTSLDWAIIKGSVTRSARVHIATAGHLLITTNTDQIGC